MKIRSILNLTLIISVAAFGGCKTNLLNGEGVSTTQTEQNQTPPQPVVVDGVRTSYADIVQKTAPAVVRIESQIKAPQQQTQQFPFGSDDFFRQLIPNQRPQQPQQQPRQQIERGVGSGVIVQANGTILTNNHVVEGADKITVQLNDNKQYDAKLVGSDKLSDLAVIKIEGENLPFLTLGNSDNVRIGDIVLAIGNPLGIGQTVTQGIISAKGRRTGLSDGSSFQDFLQTDAAINRGNSGGALVNVAGELIGINSQILSPSGGSIGIGFSIPSNMAKSVMQQLVENGKVRRGMLGVNIQDVNQGLAGPFGLKDTFGVIVSNVRAGSSADKAGIKRGDIITAINGEKTDDGNVLRNKVAETLPGNQIKITLLRDGAQQEVTATLDEYSTETAKADNDQEQKQSGESDQPQSGKLGLSLRPVTPDIARQLELPEAAGLVVTDLDPNGAAADSSIARGDVILEINRKAVNSLEEVQAALTAAGDKPLVLLISRQGQTVFVPVTPR